MVKDVIRLHPEAQHQGLALVNTGRAVAATLLHARILRTADRTGEERRGTDAESAAALDTSSATVHRMRQAWVAGGLETA